MSKSTFLNCSFQIKASGFLLYISLSVLFLTIRWWQCSFIICFTSMTYTRYESPHLNQTKTIHAHWFVRNCLFENIKRTNQALINEHTTKSWSTVYTKTSIWSALKSKISFVIGCRGWNTLRDFFWEPSSQLVINNSLMWDDDDEYSFSPFTLYILLSKQEFPLFSKIMWIFHLFNHCFYYCA